MPFPLPRILSLLHFTWLKLFILQVTYYLYKALSDSPGQDRTLYFIHLFNLIFIYSKMSGFCVP